MAFINPALSRASMARLDLARQEAQAPPDVDAADQDASPAGLLQRFIQNSDEMSAALTQFRNRRLFELKTDSRPESFESVLDDDVVPKARQVLALCKVADKPVEWLLQMARGLFPDDSDLVLVLRELIRRRQLEGPVRQRLESLLEQVIAQASPKRLKAGINSALKARLFGRAMALRAGFLRQAYRDFLESDAGAASCYEDWVALFGPNRRAAVLAFIEAALLTDIDAQDPSCSRSEFGSLLVRLADLKRLRSADAMFVGGLLNDALVRRYNPEELDWLVFFFGVLKHPGELDQLLSGVLGEQVLLALHRERSMLLQAVRRMCLQLPAELFVENAAAEQLAGQFATLADIAYAHEQIEQRCGMASAYWPEE
ncbi:type III secretion system gatekeeper subunit SctW [Pseudomonas gingeri]|uniref:type III secretion system gatekeeper subunit SctW n=1 Tax=Pseudomonas gingeri TaxID=117681 RepID=UPI0015A19F73|nr:type III secretion system gatekeeper subunit SctW [Pseudomonas gingeri]NVZ99850.1 type III secretion system gatekeeper subunit SctW [Pseudomonas gingeri]NWA16690.1 type III secretion system gatekeeper subunit SctW [Pseudomonas gingeri]NWA53924.1 type III secretion system gatekeeper subunit SctW [Pseudomonas gingeri]NWA94156.1 type III secretion system gatekeeper subunit SctW [Pseudomonas gingeri]NWB01944.1 type III secretion system gatekeeper subunit SctW [Pseudomonas gingeri]